MKNIIKNFELSVLENTKFVHPVKLTYNQNGKDKTWEAVKSFDSVAVLLYHEEFDAFVLVKQFRPPVYLNDSTKTFTYELCAGIVDKESSLETIVQEEIDEECGYKVKLESISKITSFYTNVGVSGAKQHLYYAKINESMKVHNGGGIHDEEIELHFLKTHEAKAFIYDESKAKTPGLIFAFYWFFEKVNSK
ncbi:MAG: NUDIX hydrolase [Arcobacteraceae bacterium]